MLKISKALIGIILIPTVLGISLSLFESLSGIAAARISGSRVFMWGVISYVLLHLFIVKPNYVYTLGHEMMHAITALMFGGRVRSMNVSEEGGSVETTSTNFIITLSPYLIPAYTLIFSLLYIILPLFIKNVNFRSPYLFLAGASLALHPVFTADVLKKDQPDIINTGYLFSLAIIFIVNLLIAGSVICGLFEGITLKAFFHDSYLNSKAIYIKVFRQLFFL
jgi:hypothetical protein